MEQALMRGVQANSAIAEKRIFFRGLVQIPCRLVAANIEGANDNGSSLGRTDCLGVNRELFLFRWGIIPAQKNHFCSEQSDTFRSVFECDGNLFSGRDIRRDFERSSI